MAKLTDDHRRYIVQALACYDTPSEIVDAVREEFALTLSRQQVGAYDPTKATAVKGLAKKWRDLFHTTRERFLAEAAEIPIAKQSYRLRGLQAIYQRAVRMKNLPLAAQMLEQAAKEVGGTLTNKRELTGKNGGPLNAMSDDQLAAAFSAIDPIEAAAIYAKIMTGPAR